MACSLKTYLYSTWKLHVGTSEDGVGSHVRVVKICFLRLFVVLSQFHLQKLKKNLLNLALNNKLIQQLSKEIRYSYDRFDHIVDEAFVNLVFFMRILNRSRVHNHTTVTKMCMLVWLDDDECLDFCGNQANH